MPEQITPELLAKQIKESYSAAIDEVKAVATTALGRAEKGEELSNSIKEKADEALLKMNELAERVHGLEQTGDSPRKSQESRGSIGRQFTNNDSVKSFLSSDTSQGRVRFSTKANLTSLTTDAPGSVGDAIDATRLPGIQMLPDRAFTVRALLMPGSMDGNTLEYVQETGFTNNAAPVAEGDLKPQSDIKFDIKSTGAKVIAHTMKASRQALSDIAQLESIIDQRGRYGLAFAEELQMLNGDGVGQNLTGIVPQATAYAPPVGIVPATSIDVLRTAMLQAALAEYPATAHVLHPTDWAVIEQLKDADGRYIIGNPQGTLAPTLWGLPVVATQAMAQGQFLTGSFRMAAQVFDRWQVGVEAGYEMDDFTRNMVTFRVEQRLALAVYRPEAFITGSIVA